MNPHHESLRIALVTEVFLPKIDGVVNTLCYLLQHLSWRGHSAIIFAPSSGLSEYAGARVVNLPSYTFPLYPELRLSTPFADLGSEMEAFRPDIVHLVNPVSLGLAGLRQARRLNLPVVASYQTDLPGFAEQWGLGLLSEPLWAYLSWLHSQTDLNLCPSRATETLLQARHFQRLRLWGRGVDTVRFNPQRRSAYWRSHLSGGQPDAPLLLYVGRLSPEKRVDWLVEVLHALPGVRLAVVGHGPARERLEASFAGLPVVFTGFLHGDNLADAYASADAFVFPSANETFGNTVLEAMASGLPVVAARAGGPVEIVTHNLNGFLYEAESRQALVSAVQTLIGNFALMRRMAIAARDSANTRNWSSVLDGLLDDYLSLVRASQDAFPTHLAPGKALVWPKSSCSTPATNHWRS